MGVLLSVGMFAQRAIQQLTEVVRAPLYASSHEAAAEQHSLDGSTAQQEGWGHARGDSTVKALAAST